MTRREEYQKFLQSPEWKELRSVALARTDGFCQFCGSSAQQVHHVAYPKQFGSEHPHSLIPICKRCHDIAHGVQKMKALANPKSGTEISPFGATFHYFSDDGRLYATIDSWKVALQMPEKVQGWFESKAAAYAEMYKARYGELMSHSGKPVYRWHVIAKALDAWHVNYVTEKVAHTYENERFHSNYDQLLHWGYDLQERALINAANEKRKDPGGAVTTQQLVEIIKEAIAPPLREHHTKLQQHDVVIAGLPTLRDENEFITVKQAVAEQGLVESTMPQPGSRLNLGQLVGQALRERHAEQGRGVMTRLEGSSIDKLVNTYRRREIYATLKEFTAVKGSLI